MANLHTDAAKAGVKDWNVAYLSFEEKYALAKDLEELAEGLVSFDFQPDAQVYCDDTPDPKSAGHQWWVWPSFELSEELLDMSVDDRDGLLPDLFADVIERSAERLMEVAAKVRAVAGQSIAQTQQEASQGCQERFAVVDVALPPRVLVRSLSRPRAEGYANGCSLHGIETTVIPDPATEAEEAEILARIERNIKFLESRRREKGGAA